MSELIRLQIAIDDLKKIYNEYVSGGLDGSQMARKTEPQIKLIQNLLEVAYPRDVVNEFRKRMVVGRDLGGEDFDKWYDIDLMYALEATKEKSGIGRTESNPVPYLERGLTNVISFLEGLSVQKIPVEGELQQLQYRMDRLTDQLSLGQISEETYRIAMERLQERINKLKALKKA